jgi:hypothetical protein
MIVQRWLPPDFQHQFSSIDLFKTRSSGGLGEDDNEGQVEVKPGGFTALADEEDNQRPAREHPIAIGEISAALPEAAST